jgi:TPR repeat protein
LLVFNAKENILSLLGGVFDPDEELQRAVAMFRAGDVQGAVRHLAEMASYGHARSQFQLGILFLTGEVVTKNIGEAVKWLTEAANNGHADAQYYLGSIYLQGLDGHVNLRQAVKWFELASSQNHTRACNALGLRYRNGEGIAEDQFKAFRLFQRSVAAGDPGAKLNLALQYMDGSGCEKNIPLFNELLREAAREGCVEAQQILREVDPKLLAKGIVPIMETRRTDS